MTGRVPQRDQSQCDTPRFDHRPPPAHEQRQNTVFRCLVPWFICTQDALRIRSYPLEACLNVPTPAVRSASLRMSNCPPVIQIRNYAKKTALALILTANYIGSFSGMPWRRHLYSCDPAFTGVYQAITPAQETQDVGCRRRADRSGADLLQTLGSIRCNVRTTDVPADAELNRLYSRLASGPPNPIPTKLESGACLKWAEKEAHLDFPITRQLFLSGKHCSPIHTGDVDTAPVRTSASSIKRFVPPTQFRPPIGASGAQKKPIPLRPVNLINPPAASVNASSPPIALPDSYWSAQWSGLSLLFAMLGC